MHHLAKKIAECLKAKVEGMGIDNISGEDLKELGEWTDIIKDIMCYDKDLRIIEAMDKAEDDEESMRYIEMYEDYPEMRKGYRGQPRNSKGQYMSRRGRRGYEEPMWNDMYPMEEYRDMDRHTGRMYYAGQGNMSHTSGTGNSTGMSHSMSRSEQARRGYEETKMMNDNSPEGRKKAMENLENYMKELSEEVTQFIGKMDANEKNLMRAKLQALQQKIV